MRMSLIIFGVIFLVLGGLLYFVPTQEFKADTTTTGDGNGDEYTGTSSANVTIPIAYAYASALIGLILLFFGFVIPGQSTGNRSKEDYDQIVESKEDIEVGDGNKRKIVRERTERHKSR